MKKFIVLVIVAFAAWQAWIHYPTLFEHRPTNDAVVSNDSRRGIVKLRLTVGGRTFVREKLADGESATFPFRLDHDSPFRLEWEWSDAQEERNWSGGLAPAGPAVERFTIKIVEGGTVLYTAEAKPSTG